MCHWISTEQQGLELRPQIYKLFLQSLFSKPEFFFTVSQRDDRNKDQESFDLLWFSQKLLISSIHEHWCSDVMYPVCRVRTKMLSRPVYSIAACHSVHHCSKYVRKISLSNAMGLKNQNICFLFKIGLWSKVVGFDFTSNGD